MDRFLQTLVIIVALIVIVAGVLYITNQFSVNCFNWWPFHASTCTVTKT